jgi:hypothetical protein
MDGGHLPMLSRPAELTGRLIELAGESPSARAGAGSPR